MERNSQKQYVRLYWPTLLAERKAAEYALQDSEARFRNLIEGSIQGILIHRSDGKPLFVNRAFVDVLGYASSQDILTMASIDALLDYEEIDRFRARQEVLMREGNAPEQYEFNALQKDGALVILKAVARKIMWDGEPAIQTTVVDITDNKLAKTAFADAEEKLRAIANASQNAIILIDSAGKVTFWNTGAEDMFGYTSEEVIGVEMAELIIPERDRDRHRASMARFAQSGNSEIGKAGLVNVKALRRSREIFPAELSISPIHTKGKWSAVGIVTDVTERGLVETQLKREIEFQKAISEILKVSLEPIGLREKLSRILDLVLSVPGLDILGRGAIFLSTGSGMLEMWAQKHLAEPLLEKCAYIPFGYCLCGRAARCGKIVHAPCVDHRHDVQYTGMSPHGHYCVPILSGTGRVLGVLNTYIAEKHEKDHDEVSFLNTIASTLAGVIEHHRMEDRYRGLSQAVEQSSAAVVITDTKGNIEYVNSKFVDVTGYSVQEVLGKNSRLLKSGETKPEEYAAMWKTISAGGEWRGEFHNRRKNGEMLIESASISPIKSNRGVITHFVAVKEDITERKVMESQRSHAQKMESIGQLAAGIAHEINTPTQYIGDNLRFLDEAFGDTARLLDAYETVVSSPVYEEMRDPEQRQVLDKLKEDLDIEYLKEEVPQSIVQALEGVAQVSRIVGAMKQFAHPGAAEKVPADLNAAIESTATVARNEWKYVADLVLELEPDLPPVPCLIGDINQVILNMIINAAHAIQEKLGETTDEKGTITITTHAEGAQAVIRIRDTGAGIPEHLQTRIFDHFFTTKEVGKGTGQGLAISHSVVHEKHGGYIRCESQPGVGTTFGIFLPLNDTGTDHE
jgi:PAS domain S-box-containing protein